MSINFTSDIDGATSGSGITKITVGGKTINLSEVSSGGVASGSFTPEEKTYSYTIDTGVDFTHFFVGKKTATLNYGYRIFIGCFVDITNDLVYFVGTNSGGKALVANIKTFKDFSAAESIDSYHVRKNGTNIVITSNSACALGALCPEEYIWYAW